MIVLNNFTFHDEASTTGNGEELVNIKGQSLIVGVSGTFTGTIKMQGKQEDEWYDLAVVGLSDVSKAETISAAGSYAVVGVEGFNRIRASITALSAGSVTVTGRLCDEQGTALPLSMTSGGGGGSGDFEYCTVTVQLTSSGAVAISIPYISDEEEYEGMYSQINLADSTPRTLKVPLYKGFAIGHYEGNFANVSTSGNVTFHAEAGGIEITGDGTITIGGDSK